MHAAACAPPSEERGRPGRTLILRNGDLLLSVSAYAPHGSEERHVDVQEGLARIVENTARRMEDGLRDQDAPTTARSSAS